MNRRAPQGREKALGAEHPDTLTGVNDLASVGANRETISPFITANIALLTRRRLRARNLRIELDGGAEPGRPCGHLMD
jgi:hypothetical protein